MKILPIAICASAVFFAGVGHASPRLAAASNCFSCHQIDPPKKGAAQTLGPSFRDVAARYRKDNTAYEKLVAKIHKGGSGQWGINNMPPQELPDADARAIVRWILKLK
jgi:cytochrome c